MKILIAIPCMDQVAAPFAQSLVTLEKGTDQTFISMIIGSLIYESRNNFCKQAMALKADAVLWLDSDMIIPPDALVKLSQHLTDGKDFVTGLYFRRRMPFTPVLFKKLGHVGGVAGDHENYNDYPRDSVFEVEGCGFGCVMTSVAMIEDVLLNYQTWFEPKNNLGEDLAFCARARELGYKIFCDSTIKCGHIGQVIVDEKVYESSIKEG